jgi:prepilin-type N-terminal cleavage/methylation domain-containing protein
MICSRRGRLLWGDYLVEVHKSQRGYTLVEMLVAISISTLLIMAVGSYAANSVVGSNQDFNKTLVLTNAREAVGLVARQNPAGAVGAGGQYPARRPRTRGAERFV